MLGSQAGLAVVISDKFLAFLRLSLQSDGGQRTQGQQRNVLFKT